MNMDLAELAVGAGVGDDNNSATDSRVAGGHDGKYLIAVGQDQVFPISRWIFRIV